MLTELKKILTTTKDNKYAVAVHEDAQKLIPRTAAIYKVMEDLVVNDTADDVRAMAVAQKLDPIFSDFNTVNEWYSKINPKSNKKAKTS
eukprot:4856880-Pyramimonas_sp.AAC.1